VSHISTEKENLKDYTPKSKDYWAKLPEFEGPLDILLHFVKEDELNIYDIPISKITKDFLGYVNYMQSLDIELAGEFLLMATELMKIKARMLIPADSEETEGEEEDPRINLVRKLLEYKRFKEASASMNTLLEEARKRFTRGYFGSDYVFADSENDMERFDMKNLTIFNLIKGYREVILSIRSEVVHPIQLLSTTPEEQRDYIIRLLFERTKVNFYEIFAELIEDKMKIICTFLAVLQLALEGFLIIDVNQDDRSDFSISKAIPIQN